MASMRGSGLGFAPVSKSDAADYSSSSGDDSASNDEYRLPNTNPANDADDAFRFHGHKRKRNKNRHQKENAKERAALGIFGSESEDDGPRKRWKEKSLGNKGVSFVSKTEEIPKDNQDQDKADKDEEHKQQNQANMRNKGFRPAQADDYYNEDDDDDEDSPTRPSFGLGLGQGFVPTSAMQPTVNENLKDESPASRAPAGPSAFGKKGQLSFAQRQMMKMGWKQGEGLGKEAQGRNTAVEANLRPMGVGLGAVKEKSEQERKEEKRQAALRGETIIDSDEERKNAKRERKKRRNRNIGGESSAIESGASTPRRQKPKFLTKVEMEDSGMKLPEVFAQILDMTGRDQRTITTGSGLMTPTNRQPPGDEAVERAKINDRAYAELNSYKHEFDSLDVRKKFIALRINDDSDLLVQGQSKLGSFAKLEKIAKELSVAATDTNLAPMDRWNQVTSELMVGSHDRDELVELVEVAVSILSPLMQAYAHDWDVLQEPTRFAVELSDLQPILGFTCSGPSDMQKYNEGQVQANGIHRIRKSTTPYETMIYKVWFPKVLSALRNWDAREPGPILELFQAWNNILPAFVRSQLLDNIARKLNEAVQKWKPRKHKHRDLVHNWLFCWLPHLPEYQTDPMSKTGLVADSKRKWRSVIDHWDLRDGIIPGLIEWKPKLSRKKGSAKTESDAWHQLVLNHLLPRMGRYLHRHFEIEPSSQSHGLHALADILLWDGIFSSRAIGELLVVEVFPRFQRVLYEWLISKDPNYCEIADWLRWWHDRVIPPELVSLPSVTAEFEKSLTMVNQALILGATAKYHLVPLGSEQPDSKAAKDQVPSAAAQRERDVEPLPFEQKKDETTFKDVLEDFCINNDYQFIPLRNKASADGHPMFRITARNDGKGGLTGWFLPDGIFMAQVPGYTGHQVVGEKGYSTALHAFLGQE